VAIHRRPRKILLTVLKIRWVCAFDEKAIWWNADLMNCRFDELPLWWIAALMNCRFNELPLHHKHILKNSLHDLTFKVRFREKIYKTFYGRKLLNFRSKLECFPQLSLMFGGQVTSLLWSRAPERCFTWVSSCLTSKHYTILQRLARDKHSSLLRKFVNCGRKKFYNIGPRWTRNFCKWTKNKKNIHFYAAKFYYLHRDFSTSLNALLWYAQQSEWPLMPLKDMFRQI
jgi:hypothetical protein